MTYMSADDILTYWFAGKCAAFYQTTLNTIHVSQAYAYAINIVCLAYNFKP